MASGRGTYLSWFTDEEQRLCCVVSLLAQGALDGSPGFLLPHMPHLLWLLMGPWEAYSEGH